MFRIFVEPDVEKGGYNARVEGFSATGHGKTHDDAILDLVHLRTGPIKTMTISTIDGSAVPLVQDAPRSGVVMFETEGGGMIGIETSDPVDFVELASEDGTTIRVEV